MAVDFEQALKVGFESALKAEYAREQIDGVFEDLNKQIRGITEGKIRIERNIPNYSGWITAANRDAYAIRHLAEWGEGDEGYPIHIEWNNIGRLCSNVDDLRQCLVDLLSDPEVGRSIYELKGLPPQPKNGGPNDDLPF